MFNLHRQHALTSPLKQVVIKTELHVIQTLCLGLNPESNLQLGMEGEVLPYSGFNCYNALCRFTLYNISGMLVRTATAAVSACASRAGGLEMESRPG